MSATIGRRVARYGPLLAVNIGSGVAALLASALIARSLGQDGKGMIALVTLSGLLGGIFSDLGLSASAVYLGRRRPERRNELYTILLVWAITAGLLGSALTAVGLWHLSGAAGELSGVALFLGGALAMPTLSNGLFRQVLLVEGRLSAYNLSISIEAWLVPVLLGVTWFVAGRLSIESTLIIYCIAWYAAALVPFSILRWSMAWQDSRTILGEALKYGLPAHTGTTLQFINYRLDVFLTNSYAGAAALGIYSVAFNIAEILWRVPRLVALLLFPKVAGASVPDANILTIRVFRTFLLVNAAATLLLVGVSIPGIPAVFGEEFRPATTLLLILAPGVYFASWQLLLVEHLKGLGAPSSKTYTSAAGVIVTIAVGIPLISEFGAIGAAMTSTIAYGSSSLVAIFLFCHATALPASTLFVFSPATLYRELRGSR